MTNTFIELAEALPLHKRFSEYADYEKEAVLLWVLEQKNFGQKAGAFMGPPNSKWLRVGRYDFRTVGDLLEFAHIHNKYNWQK